MAHERRNELTRNTLVLFCLIIIFEGATSQRRYNGQRFARIIRRTVLPDGTIQVTIHAEDAYRVNGRLTAYVPLFTCVRTIRNGAFRQQYYYRCPPQVVLENRTEQTAQTNRSPRPTVSPRSSTAGGSSLQTPRPISGGGTPARQTRDLVTSPIRPATRTDPVSTAGSQLASSEQVYVNESTSAITADSPPTTSHRTASISDPEPSQSTEEPTASSHWDDAVSSTLSETDSTVAVSSPTARSTTTASITLAPATLDTATTNVTTHGSLIPSHSPSEPGGCTSSMSPLLTDSELVTLETTRAASSTSMGELNTPRSGITTSAVTHSTRNTTAKFIQSTTLISKEPVSLLSTEPATNGDTATASTGTTLSLDASFSASSTLAMTTSTAQGKSTSSASSLNQSASTSESHTTRNASTSDATTIDGTRNGPTLYTETPVDNSTTPGAVTDIEPTTSSTATSSNETRATGDPVTGDSQSNDGDNGLTVPTAISGVTTASCSSTHINNGTLSTTSSQPISRTVTKGGRNSSKKIRTRTSLWPPPNTIRPLK